MKNVRPRHVLFASLLAESLLFVTAAFAGNYLIAKAAKIYALAALALFIAYVGFRWFMLRADWYRVKVFETLSDHIADSAAAYGITDLYNMQIAADQNRRNTDTQLAVSTANSMFLCANPGASYPFVSHDGTLYIHDQKDESSYEILGPIFEEAVITELLAKCGTERRMRSLDMSPHVVRARWESEHTRPILTRSMHRQRWSL